MTEESTVLLSSPERIEADCRELAPHRQPCLFMQPARWLAVTCKRVHTHTHLDPTDPKKIDRPDAGVFFLHLHTCSRVSVCARNAAATCTTQVLLLPSPSHLCLCLFLVSVWDYDHRKFCDLIIDASSFSFNWICCWVKIPGTHLKADPCDVLSFEML